MGNREDLLGAAVRCIQEKGYAKTTLRDIAGVAGVSMAAVGAGGWRPWPPEHPRRPSPSRGPAPSARSSWR
ncbi:TetR/AcrR family transcriptional regulator [Actinomadura citrea]|uniref:TetR/AcrR family transcriptional regulator n=1 Tax=Actinomadura citrea TaxID=46158 RepID=UPI001C54F38F|nr:helix-turn-helix domain-containing protein [Actinomadura citrea]